MARSNSDSRHGAADCGQVLRRGRRTRAGKQWDESDWMRARVRYRLAVARGIERERGAGGDA